MGLLLVSGETPFHFNLLQIMAVTLKVGIFGDIVLKIEIYM